MPAKVVLDRGYPDYGPCRRQQLPSSTTWPGSMSADGPGARSRGLLSAPTVRSSSVRRIPLFSFAVRALAGNGLIWNGTGTGSHSLFPEIASLAAENRPSENMLSLALRLSYGRFSYYTGADLSCDTRDGRFPWMDVETPVARVAGRVEVAVANHHGYFDACGPDFVRLLDAQAYVIPSWHLSHPGQAQIQRLLGDWPGVARHDVFATEMLPGNRLLNERFVTANCAARRGHAHWQSASPPEATAIPSTFSIAAVKWDR